MIVPLIGILTGLAVMQAPVSRQPLATFGTTVFSSYGFRGDIYFLEPETLKLPRLERLKPAGSVYTNVLQVTTRDWVQEPGKYNFSLMSDDGSKLYIDGKTLINNDGLHSVLERTGSVTLKRGVHRIRVSYFQGPGFGVALILDVARPGEEWRPFDLDQYLPPPGHEYWK